MSWVNFDDVDEIDAMGLADFEPFAARCCGTEGGRDWTAMARWNDGRSAL